MNILGSQKWISSSISRLQTGQILTHLEILSYLPVSMLSLWLLTKFHKCFSMRIFSCNIKINQWCIAVLKNITKFKLLWIAKGMFPVGNIFLLHVIYKMQDGPDQSQIIKCHELPMLASAVRSHARVPRLAFFPYLHQRIVLATCNGRTYNQ